MSHARALGYMPMNPNDQPAMTCRYAGHAHTGPADGTAGVCQGTCMRGLDQHVMGLCTEPWTVSMSVHEGNEVAAQSQARHVCMHMYHHSGEP